MKHLLDRRYVGMGSFQVFDKPDPEHGDGGVVLGWVATDVGRVPNREAGDSFGVLQVIGLLQHGPCETKMSLVPEVATLARLLHHSQPVGEIEVAHDGRF
jgi:hypothetical protein